MNLLSSTDNFEGVNQQLSQIPEESMCTEAETSPAPDYHTLLIEKALCRLMGLRQGSKSIKAHIFAFNTTRKHIPTTILSEEALRIILIRSLNFRYSIEALKSGQSTLYKLLEYLRRLGKISVIDSDSRQNKCGSGTDSKEFNSTSTTTKPRSYEKSTVDFSKWTKKEICSWNQKVVVHCFCFFCKRHGHMQQNCRARRRALGESAQANQSTQNTVIG